MSFAPLSGPKLARIASLDRPRVTEFSLVHASGCHAELVNEWVESRARALSS